MMAPLRLLCEEPHRNATAFGGIVGRGQPDDPAGAGLARPWFETPAAWMTYGVAPDLEDAVREAVAEIPDADPPDGSPGDAAPSEQVLGFLDLPFDIVADDAAVYFSERGVLPGTGSC